MESDVKEVGLASGVEELKRRLEVLLGAKPHAPIDETEKQRQQQEAEHLARRARVTEAGGQLLAAALTFLTEVIPPREPTNDRARIASDVKACLHECLERDEQGRPRLTVTLPNGYFQLDFVTGAAISDFATGARYYSEGRFIAGATGGNHLVEDGD